MICPGCNKFPAFSTDTEPECEPEIEAETMLKSGGPGLPEVEDPNRVSYTVSGTCRIVLTSECCGEECKESTFDIEIEGELERAAECVCDLTELDVEVESIEMTERQEAFRASTIKSGPNKGQIKQTPIAFRYQKRFYGATATFTSSCECGKTTTTDNWSDEMQASQMEELS
jgi:hypothetical protein